MSSYLPVLGFTLEHHGVLGLADLACILLLDVLGTLLGLDAIILGEGALVTGAAGVGEEVRADGLDGALGRGSDLADGLEVLISGPSFGEDGQRSGDEGCVRHLVEFACGDGDGRSTGSRRNFFSASPSENPCRLFAAPLFSVNLHTRPFS